MTRREGAASLCNCLGTTCWTSTDKFAGFVPSHRVAQLLVTRVVPRSLRCE